MNDDPRLQALHARLTALPGAVVAFSGGVDSAMLLHACETALGDRVLAVTADSPSLPRAELDSARELARTIGVRHRVLATDELASADYRKNDSDRCYHCKSTLFESVAAALHGTPEAEWPVLFGAITDDLGDHRPGQRAAQERGVLAPLADAGLGKSEVRAYSRAHGLPTAEKASFACLASRVPYGTAIDAALLGQLERAEAVLRGLGYRQFRVRHHDRVARVELEPDALRCAITRDREAISRGILAAGYDYVALDMVGYRTGSMNEVL